MELRSNLTEFSRLIFGADTTCKQARKFWEPSSPTTQCNNVFITGPFKNGTICYICGMEINKAAAAAGVAAAADNTDDSDDSDENGKDGRNPECEHILPIGLAIIYLGLYSPSFKGSEWYNKDILKYEYAWAHRTCNQIKSDESFITVNADNTEFNVNNTNLEKFLGRIWTTTRNDSQKFKEVLHNAYGYNEKMFITNRMNSLNSQDDQTPSLKKFKDITVFLNKIAAPGLVLLAGACCALEGNLKSKEGQQKQCCMKDPAAVEKIRQEENERIKTKLGAEYDKHITKIYKKYKDIASAKKGYYIEIMMRLSKRYFSDWIQFINNEIQIKINNNEINTLQKSRNTRHTRRIEPLLKAVKNLEKENILLHAVNNAAIIVTTEKNLLEDAWVLLPGKAIKNVNTTAAEILRNLHTISLSNASMNGDDSAMDIEGSDNANLYNYVPHSDTQALRNKANWQQKGINDARQRRQEEATAKRLMNASNRRRRKNYAATAKLNLNTFGKQLGWTGKMPGRATGKLTGHNKPLNTTRRFLPYGGSRPKTRKNKHK